MQDLPRSKPRETYEIPRGQQHSNRIAPPSSAAMPAQRASRRTERNMALADIETELTIPWRTCTVCHHISERGDKWGEQLHRLLANRGVKFKDIAKALADDPDEPDILAERLSRHASGGCEAMRGKRLR